MLTRRAIFDDHQIDDNSSSNYNKVNVLYVLEGLVDKEELRWLVQDVG